MVEKTQQINEAGNEIWLNLITREKQSHFYNTGKINVNDDSGNNVYLTLDDKKR